MNTAPKLPRFTGKVGMEQKFVIDGCKVTVRYGAGKNPSRMDEIKSLLLSAQLEVEKA